MKSLKLGLSVLELHGEVMSHQVHLVFFFLLSTHRCLHCLFFLLENTPVVGKCSILINMGDLIKGLRDG